VRAMSFVRRQALFVRREQARGVNLLTQVNRASTLRGGFGASQWRDVDKKPSSVDKMSTVRSTARAVRITAWRFIRANWGLPGVDAGPAR